MVLKGLNFKIDLMKNFNKGEVMLIKIEFELGDEKYFVNVSKKTLNIKKNDNSNSKFYHLEFLDYVENRVVMDTIIDGEPTIWDYENLDFKFVYKKGKK